MTTTTAAAIGEGDSWTGAETPPVRSRATADDDPAARSCVLGVGGGGTMRGRLLEAKGWLNRIVLHRGIIPEFYLVFHWRRRAGCCVAARCCGGSPVRAGSCSSSAKGLAGPRGRPSSASGRSAAGERAAVPCGTLPTCGTRGSDVITHFQVMDCELRVITSN